MSTHLTTLGPLCQAAIITFKPFQSFFHITGAFLLLALILKLTASLLKTKLSISKQISSEQLPTTATALCKRYNFPIQKLYILNSPFLNAFSSVLPGVADGIFLSKKMFSTLSDEELEAVFLHELYHWQSNQTISQLTLKLFAEVLFFIPVIKEILNDWLLRSELAADYFASSKLKSTLPLKQALTKWLSQDTHTFAWTVSFAETQLNARIDALNSDMENVQKHHLPQITTKGLFISLIVIGGIALLGTSEYSKAEATLIIPTNSQCERVWQQTINQSTIDSVMSPKID